MNRAGYGLVLAILGLFESLWVAFVGIAPAPWAYVALVGPLMLLLGGLLVGVNLGASAGSRIASVGAGAVTLWAAGMGALAVYSAARGEPATGRSDQVIFFAVLVLLVAIADWASYRAVTATRKRREA